MINDQWWKPICQHAFALGWNWSISSLIFQTKDDENRKRIMTTFQSKSWQNSQLIPRPEKAGKFPLLLSFILLFAGRQGNQLVQRSRSDLPQYILYIFDLPKSSITSSILDSLSQSNIWTFLSNLNQRLEFSFSTGPVY